MDSQWQTSRMKQRRALRELATYLEETGVGTGDELWLAAQAASMTDEQLREVPFIGGFMLREVRAWHRSLGVGLPPGECEQRAQAAIAYLTCHGYEVRKGGHVWSVRAEVPEQPVGTIHRAK